MTEDREALPITTLSVGLPPETLAARVFAGEVLAFDGLPGTAEIVARGNTMLAAAFDGYAPDEAHHHLPPATLKSRLLDVRRKFAENVDVATRYEAALAAAGCDPATSFRDRLVLRGVPPVAELETDDRVILPPHRDTWGSGLLAQINWWMPITPLAPGRTMVLFPQAWDHAVPNDSAGWVWQRARETDYPSLPSTTVAPPGPPVPVLVEPGTLVAFSGAHLHATEVNRTDAPRFSTDTRTVDLAHLRAGQGAPDRDHGPVAPAHAWFRGFGSGVALVHALGEE